jgi:hypothetical protein
MLWPFVLEATMDGFDDGTKGIAGELRFGPVDIRCVTHTRVAELAVGRTAPPAMISLLSVTFDGFLLIVVAFPVSPQGCTAHASQVRAVLAVQSVSYQRQPAFWADR